MNRPVVDFHFKRSSEQDFRKRECGKERKQKLNTEYSNFMEHVKSQHANWNDEVKSKSQMGTVEFISGKARNIYN